MKIIATSLLLLSIASVAHADDDDGFDTAKALAGKAWVTKVLKGDAVDAPAKDKPVDYIVADPTKECKALKQGTAKDDKAFGKLKTCLLASYKANGGTEGQWREIHADQIANAVLSEFPAKYAKAIKTQAKGSTVVEGHFSGDGTNMDVFLVLDASDHPHALWLTQTQFE